LDRGVAVGHSFLDEEMIFERSERDLILKGLTLKVWTINSCTRLEEEKLLLEPKSMIRDWQHIIIIVVLESQNHFRIVLFWM
jgi:hypothetical protein